MKTDAVQDLAARYGLSSVQEEQLRLILEELERDVHAPTAVRQTRRAVDVHVSDSLVALDLDVVRSAAKIADLGAGAGFPGVALAVALPTAEVSLIESQRRECEFLERLIVRTGVGNARVVRRRAEAWREGSSANDVVVARALAAQPVVLEYAAPLLRLGGTLVDWRGRRSREDESASLAAARALGIQLVDIRRVRPFEGATDRHLHQFLKTEETSARFPRRIGVARKRPLAGPGAHLA